MKYLLILAVAVLAALFGLARMSARTPDRIGPVDGRLMSCPGPDNCVSSEAENPDRRIAPLAASGPVDDVMNRLAEAVGYMDGEVVQVRGNYLRAVFTSRLWRFRDDLECLYDQAAGRIEVRSASRVGYSDFGVNRKRVERLREMLAGR
ncbi:hypothetical protein BerOc1_01175 [Pseudodesulfovibrio hydrargyri]|uniref:DUF1499 domain-containing protein n=1 Tax=Pseudodesulfovibrio hydrargyri TaxID=2125990 RepID=A0A1J5MTB7_9BACT|nr:DUF1499 domain-containing protein [Pseudodesulfovibrio hydrargyri]OIQ49250.1 hypothetical protein BerOc1_01175 [Pseudodesulfovibrio hydrargyri]